MTAPGFVALARECAEKAIRYCRLTQTAVSHGTKQGEPLPAALGQLSAILEPFLRRAAESAVSSQRQLCKIHRRDLTDGASLLAKTALERNEWKARAEAAEVERADHLSRRIELGHEVDELREQRDAAEKVLREIVESCKANDGLELPPTRSSVEKARAVLHAADAREREGGGA